MPTLKITGILIISFIALLPFVAGKVFSSTYGIPFMRREGGWMFLERMHLEPGALRLHLQLKLLATNYKENSLY